VAGDFRAVRAAIAARIREGAWAQGETIPSEAALAASFGVARATVHRALRELAEAGLVERRRRAGTRVLARARREATLPIRPIRDEIEATGATYGYRLVDRAEGPAPEAVAGALGLAPGATALRVRCLHAGDGAPFVFEDRWINLAVAPGAAAESFAERGPNAWLIETVPFDGARHAFAAVAADAAAARLLGTPEGAPLLCCERVTWRAAGRATGPAAGRITFARLLYRGGAHRLIAETHSPI
jgi:GntR family histidine utilization transcriptional repressor